MKNSKLAALLSLCLSAATFAPAFAADDDLFQKTIDSSMLIPRVAAVGAAMVVGTPIAIFRTTWDNWTESTPKAADHVGGKDCGPSNLLASVYTVPLSLVIGGTKGTYKGMSNAFSGFEKPFTHETFSMGDLDSK